MFLTTVSLMLNMAITEAMYIVLWFQIFLECTIYIFVSLALLFYWHKGILGPEQLFQALVSALIWCERLVRLDLIWILICSMFLSFVCASIYTFGAIHDDIFTLAEELDKHL